MAIPSLACRPATSLLLVLLLAVAVVKVDGFSAQHKIRSDFRREATGNPRRTGSTTLFYMPPSSTSQTPPMTAQNLLNVPGVSSTTKGNDKRQGSPLSLSPAILESCSTVHSKHNTATAQGMLSPETVMRLERMSPPGGRSQALDTFLSAYRRDGPMACMSFLSDPEILPQLTSAMREIAC